MTKKRRKKESDSGLLSLLMFPFYLAMAAVVASFYIIVGFARTLLKGISFFLSGGKNQPEKKEIADMTGYEFEEYVARLLGKAGYTHVDITPKSGDYGADILAVTPAKLFSLNRGKKICFQCKKYSKPVGVKAVQEVIGAMAYYHCEVGSVVSVSGFTDAARKLAESAGVVLMGADEIR